MQFPIFSIDISEDSYPSYLKEIPDPPHKIYVRGNLPKESVYLAVVGSRNYTNYGKQTVSTLISGLRGYPITIVSGLALGIDALAHEAALQNGLSTIAVPGSGINDQVLYPQRNRGLAARILERGSALLSEFEPDFEATTWSFPKRNRIMAGLSKAVLLIEASEKSGTLITARLAAEYNRELLAVPGSIFSESSRGTHQFLKLGATMVTRSEDIIEALGLESRTHETKELQFEHPAMSEVLILLNEPKDRDELIRMLPLTIEECGVILMQMELEGYIKEDNGMFYKT